MLPTEAFLKSTNTLVLYRIMTLSKYYLYELFEGNSSTPTIKVETCLVNNVQHRVTDDPHKDIVFINPHRVTDDPQILYPFCPVKDGTNYVYGRSVNEALSFWFNEMANTIGESLNDCDSRIASIALRQSTKDRNTALRKHISCLECVLENPSAFVKVTPLPFEFNATPPLGDAKELALLWAGNFSEAFRIEMAPVALESIEVARNVEENKLVFVYSCGDSSLSLMEGVPLPSSHEIESHISNLKLFLDYDAAQAYSLSAIESITKRLMQPAKKNDKVAD